MEIILNKSIFPIQAMLILELKINISGIHLDT